MDVKSLLVICSFSLIAGCATSGLSNKIVDTPPPAVMNDDAAIKIAEAANSISQSLSNLEALQQATTPSRVHKSLPDPGIDGMSDLVSVDWSGPIAPLLQKVATASHYKLRVIGVNPAIPIIVSITSKDTPLSYVLRDADLQCGKRANIFVYPATRTIELRYASA